ncbi:MAG TPA: hypothetical protein VJL89_00940 [Thermodesulfovibrionia bacterium]|nr:hypothetical protein [Thermodesulfovibrionia bacterium]
MRKSDYYFILLLINILFTGFLVIWSVSTKQEHEQQYVKDRKAVRELGLTDLCLFTEARYTRHISQADLHTAFQDSPMSMEHFPSGSFVLPPPGLTKRLEAASTEGVHVGLD